MITRRRTLASLLGLAAAPAVAAATAAQEAKFPSRPIRLIVPYPAGSSGDIIARMLGQRLGERLGETVVIDNRPGGAGIPATRAVATAPPDGYTLLLTGLNHVTNVGLFASLPFDTARDFAPISIVGSVDLVLVAHPSTGFTRAQDLIDAAKARPGRINFASAGNGTGGHLAMELFARTAGLSLVHVPYRGATPALSDVVAGHVQILFTGVPPTLGFLKSGQLKALAVAGRQRVAALPDVPTAREIGMAGFDVDVWFGVLGPDALPAPLVATLARQIGEIVREGEFRARLQEQGVSPSGSTPAEFAAVLHKDLERWPKFIRDLGIKVE
jgi:tripartite-type tricarboxylate transporter receptor subunit TctC